MNAARTILLALLLSWVFPALADVAVPPLVGRVVDLTGTLSTNDVSALNQTIRAFEARKGSQVAVLIVPTTDGEAIEQYSIRVAEAWKIGRKKIDDGVLLVIAKNDRKLRIEVGYGLEGALTDVTSKRIIDEIITPRFRNGDFSGGISAGVDRILRVVEGEKLPAPAQSEPQQGFQPSWLLDHVNPFNPFMIFAVLIWSSLIPILASASGRLALTALEVIGVSAGGVTVRSLQAAMRMIVARAQLRCNMSPPGKGGGSLWGRTPEDRRPFLATRAQKTRDSRAHARARPGAARIRFDLLATAGRVRDHRLAR